MEAPGEDGRLTLAVDVGSTAVKLLLLDPMGAWTLSEHPTDLEDIWPAVKSAIAPHAERIERVGITAQGQSALLVREGQRVGELQTWRHPLEVGVHTLGDGAILHPKGAWLPRRLKQWRRDQGASDSLTSLQIKDWLNFELTGVIASDARSMRGLLDADGRVPPSLVEWIGLGDVVPPLHAPEAVIGRVHASGAARSGLRIGTEVICGCDDLSAGVLGLAPVAGQRFNLANTSEHLGLIPAEDVAAHARETGLSFLPACGALPPLLYAATSTGAGTLIAEAVDEMPRAPPAMEGVPAFDPNLAGRRGLDPDAAHRGGWAADPSDCSAEQRAWRIAESLWAELQPISAALEPFTTEAEILAGGGLAPHLPRPVIVRCGSEVSALGLARLAQPKPHAVIFGAGKVGRGFLAQLLHRSGWRLSLVDVSRELLADLADGWTVHNLATEENEALSADLHHMTDDLFEVLDAADLLLTSIGANHLESWAKAVREPLCERLSRGDLDLVLAENHPNPAEAVLAALLDGALADEAALIETHLGIAQAQVLRSCIGPREDQAPTTVQVQDHWTLPLDGEALRTDFFVAGFEPKPDFRTELTRKLYTYNCVNAVVCYLGHLKGLEWLADAANDEGIAEIALAAGMESSAALVTAFGFDAEDQQDWCRCAMAKYQDATISDPIARNAADPVRKLGANERLLGPIQLCIAHGLPNENLLLGAAAAMRYPGAPESIDVDLAQADAQLDALLAGERIT